jgi:hypothetical protein
MLDGFLPAKAPFDLVLSFHAAMVDGMIQLVQLFLGVKGSASPERFESGLGLFCGINGYMPGFEARISQYLFDDPAPVIAQALFGQIKLLRFPF